MQSTYAQKKDTLQKASANKTESVIDSSSQSATLQRHASLANAAAQRAENPPRPNNTGLPDDLKNGIESLSGYSLDNVRVHYNSPKPATVQALAYTQGTDIHVAPGQEHALPHEAWHVAQQMAGRVTPTTNIGGMPVNDNAALEHEADVMGEKAVTQRMVDGSASSLKSVDLNGGSVQRQLPSYGELDNKGYANVENVGGAPAGAPQYEKQPGTFHHIYPKSLLKRFVNKIDRLYSYFYLEKGELKKTSGLTKENRASLKALASLRGACIQTGLATGFYWRTGTGFYGYKPERRCDDPHDQPERVKPKGMDGGVFALARDERPARLELLSTAIDDKKVKDEHLENCLRIERDLMCPTYVTVPYGEGNSDWTLKDPSYRDADGKIYNLKR